jgi:hypothetical protein
MKLYKRKGIFSMINLPKDFKSITETFLQLEDGMVFK